MSFISWDPRVDDEEFSSNGAYSSVVVPSDVKIPLLDRDAWEMYPAYQHLYNKLHVSRTSGIRSNLIGAARGPTRYPVIVRPVYNLFGIGHGATRVSLPMEFEQLDCSGYFWAEHLNGSHVSWDIALVNGDIKWMQTWISHKHSSMSPGVFARWSTQEASPASERNVENWISSNLQEFTGMVNLETIGGKVIECHLRVGDALYMGDPDLLQAIVDLYSTGEWNFNCTLKDFHMFPIWVARNQSSRWPSNEAREEIMGIVKESADVYLVEVDDDWPGDPVHFLRVMFLGFEEYSKGKEVSEKITKLFEKPLMHITV